MSPITLTDLRAHRVNSLTEDQVEWVLKISLKQFEEFRSHCDKNQLKMKDALVYLYTIKGMPYSILQSIQDKEKIPLVAATEWRKSKLDEIFLDLVRLDHDVHKALSRYESNNLRYFSKREIAENRNKFSFIDDLGHPTFVMGPVGTGIGTADPSQK